MSEPDLNTNHHQLQDQNTHNLNSIFDSQNEAPNIQLSPISKLESITENGRFFHFESIDIGPNVKSEGIDDDGDHDYEKLSKIEEEAVGITDEARHNLATRVMSNGVEVIIAGDKNGKTSLKPNVLRLIPSLSRKPMTLAPSTLKDQMILVVPSNDQAKYTIPINSKHFITKTCLTTYTYRTTYLQDGKTTVESREKVVSNTATEERNYLKISPTETLGVTLSRTPELAVGVFHTTYTYYNTILDGEVSLVVSSQHILTNTITGPDDYISFLQPSEEATPVLETNTYFSKISLTKTLKESDLEKIVSTSNILTQVIITESLQPPQSTSIMTSYVAFDIDETTTKDSSIIRSNATSSLSFNSQASFHTYSYYNADKGTTIDPKDSQKIQNDKLYLYIKKDSAESIKGPDVEITSKQADSLQQTAESKLHGTHQSDMHIYATKTYLTTFTYFTTMINTAGAVDSSTIVNFHTRVIENVITESIPSFIINTDILSSFETQLKNPLNHNSFVTMVTLTGGQSLEITAMNMLHPSLLYEKTQIRDKVDSSIELNSNTLSTLAAAPTIMSNTQLQLENSNEILDSDVASSENEEVVADNFLIAESDSSVTQNNTKTTEGTDLPSVNQLIGSLNLNRLQALGPVFNAMAGLIQNNFGTNHNYELRQKNTSILNLEGKQISKNISAYGVGNTALSHDGHIYIPVQSLSSDNDYQNTENIKGVGFSSPQSLHISPPTSETGWFMDDKLKRVKPENSLGKPKYETPLLNAGIPISPGEVITANSDIIVGKPNGIQPRIPLNNKLSDNVNPLLPPPPYSYQFQYQQHMKANPSSLMLDPSYDKQMNFDGILKPPSLQPHSLQHHHNNQKKIAPPNGFKNSNFRAHYATSHMHQPPTHYSQQMHQSRIPLPLVHKPQQNNIWPNLRRPYNPSYEPNNSNPRFASPKPNYIPYTPYDYDQQQPPPHDKNNNYDLNKNLNNNEILEIKRIPEVYSTDLPAFESSSNNSLKNPNGIYKALVKKIINSDKPMLVDIQPSKITNIVIPRDNSASILVVQSSVELHKNGQYYDEPTTYSDSYVTGGIANAPASIRKPILSNQQINLDTNVLSHNVDINVPPLTFNKDSDFPHSTPVRGQIQKNEPFAFKMPHVTIPITDNQIQVNLTPQTTITQNLSGHFVNDVELVNGKGDQNVAGAGETLQNLEPPSYQNIFARPTQNSNQIYFHPMINMSMRPIFNNQQRPVETLKPLESNFHFGHTLRPKLKGNVPVSKYSFGHFNKTLPYPNVIPISADNIGLSIYQKPLHMHSNQSAVQPKPSSQQGEPLQIFAKIEDNLPAEKPASNHLPLLNLFYDSPNLENSYVTSDLSGKPPTINYNFATEYTNRVEDQKPSSSLNIIVPAKGNLDLEFEDDKTISEQQVKEATPITTPSPHRSTKTEPSPTTQKPILHEPSITKINHMNELAASLQPAPLPPSMANLTIHYKPFPGRPFTQTRTSTKSPPIKTNVPKLVFQPGQEFKLRPHEKDPNQLNEKSVGSSDDEDRKDQKVQKHSIGLQTEAPFNPKYTKRTKKPKTNSTTSPPTSSHINLNRMEVLNNPNNNMTYNKESGEIFDYHESMNPHNFKFVHTEEGTTIKESSFFTDLMTPVTMHNTNRYQFVSEPSTDMQPPQVSIKPQTEKVMGLNPPPLPTKPISVAPVLIPSITQSLPPSTNTLNNKNITETNRNLLLTHMGTTVRPIKKPVKPMTNSKYYENTSKPQTKQTVSMNVKKNPSSYANFSDKYMSTTSPIDSPTKKVTHHKSTPLLIKPEEDLRVTSPKNHSSIKKSEAKDKLQPAQTVAPAVTIEPKRGSYDMSMIFSSQKIPEEILIEGSEKHDTRQTSISSLNNQTQVTSMTSRKPILTENHRQQSKFKLHTSAEPVNLGTHMTSPVIIPTKYITEPHFLTVTTTKVYVATSLGIPVTQTLTLTETKTSTLVDTVTETHTLLQPTRVTESHTTTSTQIIHIEPTKEVLTTKEFPEETRTSSPVVTSTTSNVDPIWNQTQDSEKNSIFVVMTDKHSQGGVFSIRPSMMDTPQNINAIGGTVSGPDSPSSIELDYDYNITFDYLPTRDEEAETNEVNHVLLGGVLIATPPKASDSLNIDGSTSFGTCRPSCKASRNELCQQIDNRMQCLCRPGFARMFPDRPCRPTYTYALHIPIHRISKQILHFKDQYRMRDSNEFKHLADITHNAVDRMVMQSDLRDVYHGVHITSFEVSNSEDGVLGKFLIQLSDNSDEKRLVDVFKKYLRQNNFSLGGTDIFTTKAGVNSLEVHDFNECTHNQFHDCSENSRCFNLQGTYTCSCQEGYADLSENSIYPGRICSAEVIGCEKCHYHGKCVLNNRTGPPVCECFSWYTGASCQLNLKFFLITLITIGTILFILLLFCVLVTCTRRRENHNMQSFMSGMHIIPPKSSCSSSKNLTMDKCVMIKDSSSEGSQNSLPYVLKRNVKKQNIVLNTNHHAQSMQQPTKIINQRGHPSLTLIPSFSEIDKQTNIYPEQNDRSLTVMIPRAKYHHSVLSQSTSNSNAQINEAQFKIGSSDAGSKASIFNYNNDKIPSSPSKQILAVNNSVTNKNHGALHTTSTGALVSAGFEVSATVGNVSNHQQHTASGSNVNLSSNENRGNKTLNTAGEMHFQKFNHKDPHLQYNTYKEGEKFIDSMDVWLDTIQQNELTAEARSFDETTIQAPTKSLRSVYERQLSQSNGNDEANTMAERDIGSTFLLPHTHLYKPDRDSDISGFDSF